MTSHSLRRAPRAPDAPGRVWRDWALVAVVIVGTIVELVVRDDVVWPLPTAAVTLLLIWPVLIRRRQPLLATAIAFTAMPTIALVSALVVGPSIGLYSAFVSLTVAYSLTRWGSGREISWGIVVLVYAWVAGTVGQTESVGDIIGGLVFLFVVVELGVIVRLSSQSRREGLVQARLVERESIARELHDTVAHHVSAIAVQAQAGRAVAASDPARAVQTLAVIEEAASRTLAEMRTMVGTLRGEHGVGGARTPICGLADLPGLADGYAGAGRGRGHPDIEVLIEAGAQPVRPSIDSALYRLAQESVTNAVRHARGATRVDVHVHGDRDWITLTVTDDGHTLTAGPVSHGYGLVGMSERTTLLGGTLEAGPRPDRPGWRVTVVLPRTVRV